MKCKDNPLVKQKYLQTKKGVFGPARKKTRKRKSKNKREKVKIKEKK